MPRYLVFGRTEYAEPLTQRGALEAGDPGQARDVAVARWGREWVELTLVPEPSVRWILRPEGEERPRA